MAEVTQQQVVDYIKGISVLELSQLVKTLEAELGVSPAAAMPIAMPMGWRARGRGSRPSSGRRREDRIHRDVERNWREQDQRDQGGARSHQSGSERGEGS